MKYFKRLKESIMNRRRLFWIIASVFVFCAVIVSVILLSTNKAEAIEITLSTDVTIDSDNMDITLDVVNNGVYVIDGQGISHNEVYVEVVPRDTSVQNVKIIIKDLKVTDSRDKSIIGLNPSGTIHACNYTLEVSGDNYLESTYTGAKNAVISAQNVSASLITLQDALQVPKYLKLSDLIKEVEASYTTSLTVTSAAGTKNSLSIVNGRNGYGAAIGGGESTVTVDVKLNAGNHNKAFEPNYKLREDGSSYDTVMSAYDYINQKYNTNYSDNGQRLYVDQQFLAGTSVNSANVTINGDVEINIKGQGYGAGIGAGGSDSDSHPAGKAGIVTFNGGTVAINMTSSGPCIGSGINAATGVAAVGNRIIIDGGSLYLTAVSSQYIGNMTNQAGKKLYAFDVDLNSQGGQGFENDWTGTMTLEDPKYSNHYSANIDVATGLANITLDASTYTYNGYGHDNIQLIGISQQTVKDRLFFYLPATPTVELTINTESYLTSGQRIKIFQNEVEKIGTNGKYVVDASTMTDIRVYDVPSVIAVKSITVGTSIYPVSTGTDEYGDYYSTAFKMPEVATSAKVNYEGDVPIEYDPGFKSTDTSNHGYVAPTVTTATFGNTVSIPSPQASDLVFDGWYLVGTDTKISSVSSADILDGSILTNGKIKLVARWFTRISYVYSINGAADITIRTDNHPYGTAYTLTPGSTSLPEPPAVNYYDFDGWNINSVIYSEAKGNEYYIDSLTSNMTVRAEYKKNRFYVYVDTIFFDATETSLMMGSTALGFDQTVYTDNGHTYYRALVTDAVDYVSLSIGAKRGYEISNSAWGVKVANASYYADNWLDNVVTYEIGLGEKDVYITNTRCAFTPKKYTVTFYDGVNQTPFKTVTYTVNDYTMPVALDTLLGDDALTVKTRYDRFHSFTGWKAITATAETDPYVTDVTSLGNYIFVAQWEEVEKHPINITVYDGETNGVSKEVGVIPYLYNPNVGSKVPLEVFDEIDSETGETKKISYVIAEDNIYFQFVALDENGDFYKDADGSCHLVELGEGIDFMMSDAEPYDYTTRYDYVSKIGEDITRKNHSNKQYIEVPDDIQVGAPIDMKIRIKLTKFTIAYWDLRGYENNDNPAEYSMFDEFDFKPLLENVGWHLVMADHDITNYDDVTTQSITGISKWSSGNLVLKADWPTDYVGYYTISIDNVADDKGKVEVVYPIAQEGYKETQSIILSVSTEDGYTLTNNSLCYTKVDADSQRSMLARNVLAADIMAIKVPVIINALDESRGMYMFAMPNSDIEISASFQTKQYSIIYDGIDESVVNDNPTSYTIEDTIILEALTKDGYDFKGFVDAKGNKVEKIENKTGDIVLTPVWSKKDVGNTTEPTTQKEKVTTLVNTTDNTTGKDKDGKETTVSSKETTKPKSTIVNNDETTTNKRGVNIEDQTTKSNFIGRDENNQTNASGEKIDTGDNTNVQKLIIVLVCAAVSLILIVMINNRNHDEEDIKNTGSEE